MRVLPAIFIDNHEKCINNACFFLKDFSFQKNKTTFAPRNLKV